MARYIIITTITILNITILIILFISSNTNTRYLRWSFSWSLNIRPIPSKPTSKNLQSKLVFFQILKIRMDFELDNQHIAYSKKHSLNLAFPKNTRMYCLHDNAILVQFLSGDKNKKVENCPMNV